MRRSRTISVGANVSRRLISDAVVALPVPTFAGVLVDIVIRLPSAWWQWWIVIVGGIALIAVDGLFLVAIISYWHIQGQLQENDWQRRHREEFMQP